MTEQPQDNNKTSRQFGRIPSKLDARDWLLEDFLPRRFSIDEQQEKVWGFPQEPLDQKNTPHCVGYAMAHFGISLPTYTQYSEKDAEGFYYKCKEIDGEPEEENGTEIRSAAKVLQSIGAIENYAFAKSIDTVRWWLVNKGPLIMGTVWTENMMETSCSGMLDVSGMIVGSHAFIVNELLDGCYGIKNSWGNDWGIDGTGYISEEDFNFLLSYGGEALAAVELPVYKKSKQGWFKKLIKKYLPCLLDYL